jgi:small subunit ribosomal protein S21
MAEIRLQEGESLENALRRFKRKVQTEDIIKEVKRHSYYLKPGERPSEASIGAEARAEKVPQRRFLCELTPGIMNDSGEQPALASCRSLVPRQPDLRVSRIRAAFMLPLNCVVNRHRFQYVW